MEDTFTTEVTEAKNGVEIYTLHDQTGSAAIGFVPMENILSTCDKLRNFIGFNLPVSGMLPLDFVKWYSGMEQQKILNAYERWKRESGNLR